MRLEAAPSASMSPQLSPTVRLRQARFEDHAEIAALEQSQGLKAKPFEEWRRLWTCNPSYKEFGPDWPIGWVLEAKGRIVGTLSNLPLSYVFQGSKLLVATGRG